MMARHLFCRLAEAHSQETEAYPYDDRSAKWLTLMPMFD